MLDIFDALRFTAEGGNMRKSSRGVKGMDRIIVTQPGHSEIACSTSISSVYETLQQANINMPF